MPIVSVIIPVYNAEKYLARCIDSVLSQSFTDFECILINDGSSDGCPAICNKYAKKDSRIKVIHKENSGVSCTRNVGLNVAQGEWITFVDSDDWVDEKYIEIMYNNAVQNDCALSICGISNVDENERELLKSKQFPIMFFDKNFAKKTFLAPKGYFTTVCVCKLVKREYLYRNNIRFDADIKIYEDSLFWFEVIDKVDRIVYDSTSCYNYRKCANTAINSPETIKNFGTSFIAVQKMMQLETNKYILKKIKLFEALLSYRMLSRIFANRNNFAEETYVIGKKHLLNSLFYYMINGDIKIKSKMMAVLYLSPRVTHRVIGLISKFGKRNMYVNNGQKVFY
ncbi:MAG: glycosyltransferase [Chitinispirillales bacterium]|jgi:glycosyltransferase involved in cell wall biosynthesis|nr:glycosyltransferase [Chitinispirillales bacterium]